MDVMSWV